MYGHEALDRLLNYSWHQCLDIGAGRGEQATYMRDAGRQIATLDSNAKYKPDIVCNYLSYSSTHTPLYEAIWCCHVLEHQINIYTFLRKIWLNLKDDGFLAITVPPLKHEIVGGHVTLWNEGLLIYNLILAGFDCQDARIGVYGYNISVIVQKKYNQKLTKATQNLIGDSGDITNLRHFFPKPIFMHEGRDGRFGNIRW